MHVTETKLQVAADPQDAALDMPAGPSETAMLADEELDPDLIASELLAQAEHGEESQVVLITPS
ncbi:hypothetical protein BCY86_08625 [Pajaroellobacter abortibovis]|uniref:Uncharacterized protein n=1 Tax=Pajaroellobacter abortibovis TaxID=1882918 RepID=A0A1L6MYU4_9BACT|nr:hypothetical protein BCY86_08625 [Pajaroellobacter abortibovis]